MIDPSQVKVSISVANAEVCFFSLAQIMHNCDRDTLEKGISVFKTFLPAAKHLEFDSMFPLEVEISVAQDDDDEA